MGGKTSGLSVLNLVMLSYGIVIGGAFFLGSAVAIRAAGPGVIISFFLAGILVYLVLMALSEMTVADPAPGSFRTYAQENLGSWSAFVVGWVYWTGMILAMSSEATAAAIFIRTLQPTLPLGLLASAIVLFVTVSNLAGARLFSRLESTLAAFKLLAVVGFIVLGALLIAGLTGPGPIPVAHIARQPLFPGRAAGIAGSMLIVMFTFAGVEVVGLAAPEARDPQRTIPRAITLAVLSLFIMYILVVLVLLTLVPTYRISPGTSPLVTALSARGIPWARDFFGVLMPTAIITTMLTSMFGLGRMLHSLSLEGHAPSWLKQESAETGVPVRGILVSGSAMLAGVSLSYVLPRQVYLFLISSGGYALLFAYLVITASHYRFRKAHGCPGHRCRMPFFPYSSYIVMASLVIMIASMPLIRGQGAGLAAGLSLTAAYALAYPLFISKNWSPWRRFSLPAMKPLGRQKDPEEKT